MQKPYKVSVVLDKEYGERLFDLTETGPVWIVDTPRNREAAQAEWARDKSRTHLTGVTTFKSGDLSAEDAFVGNLGTIDLHHGPYSADPPYTVLEVIGTPLTGRIKKELAEFGFDQFESLPDGFVAVRPLPDIEAAE